MNNIVMNAIVIALAACVPLGVILALWFNDGRWFWLCGTLIIFLS